MIIHPFRHFLNPSSLLAGKWLIYLTGSNRKTGKLEPEIDAALFYQMNQYQKKHPELTKEQIYLVTDCPEKLSSAVKKSICESFSEIHLPDTYYLGKIQNDLPAKPKPPLRKKHVVLGYVFDDKDTRWRSMGTPMAQLIMANSLEQAGHTVEILPLNASQNSLNFKKVPDIFALGLYEDTFIPVRKIIRLARENFNLKIIVGGPMVSLSPMAVIAHTGDVDAFLRGEVEVTLPAFVSSFPLTESDESFDRILSLIQIPGLMCRLQNASIWGSFDVIPEITDLTFSAPSIKHLSKKDRENGLEYSTSRGCIRNCTFCSHVHGRVLRTYPDSLFSRDLSNARHYMEKMDKTDRQLKPYSINLNDDDILLNPQRAENILEICRSNNFHLWGLQTSIESLVHEEIRSKLFTWLEEVSCFVNNQVILWLGTDAFTDKRLKRLGKSGNQDQIKQVCKDIYSKGFRGFHYWILTDADSNWEEFLTELRFLNEMRIEYGESFNILPNAGTLIPYPSTPIYRQRIQKEQFRQIYLHEILHLPGHPDLDYPLVMHEKPADDYLYSLVETRAAVSERFLAKPEQFIKLIRQNRFDEAIMQAMNVLSIEIDDFRYVEKRNELLLIKNCIQTEFYS